MRMARFPRSGGGLIVLADESFGYNESYGYKGHALGASSRLVARRALTSIISARSSSDGVFSPAWILCSTGCGVPFRARAPRHRPAPAEPPLWSFTLRHDCCRRTRLWPRSRESRSSRCPNFSDDIHRRLAPQLTGSPNLDVVSQLSS
jgi:hypothetical protein